MLHTVKLIIGIMCLSFAGAASSSIFYDYSGSSGATGTVEFSSGLADAGNFSGAAIIAGSFDFSSGSGFVPFDIFDYDAIVSNSWSAVNGEIVSVSFKANSMLFWPQCKPQRVQCFCKRCDVSCSRNSGWLRAWA